MDKKIMFKNNSSCIVIKDGKMYIASTKYKDYSCRAITIMNGFQIEIGRNINEIKQALRETRLPIIIREVINVKSVKHYQIIRMHTGNVDDKVIATVVCNNDIISIVSFNRDLIRDKDYRRYNQISVLHQLSIPFDLSETGNISRSEQLKAILSVAMHIRGNIKVIEQSDSLSAIIDSGEEEKFKILFILNSKTNRYDMTSLSLI